MSRMNDNEEALLERALATIERSNRHVAWLPDSEDAHSLINRGFLVKIEMSKYGKLIMVGAPKS